MARYAIDRIEEGIALLEVEEDGVCRMEQVCLAQLPSEAREGDILTRDPATGAWRLDREATAAARKAAFRQQQSLFE